MIKQQSKKHTQRKNGWPPENVVDDKVTCVAHSAASPVEPGGKKELPTEKRLLVACRACRRQGIGLGVLKNPRGRGAIAVTSAFSAARVSN